MDLDPDAEEDAVRVCVIVRVEVGEDDTVRVPVADLEREAEEDGERVAVILLDGHAVVLDVRDVLPDFEDEPECVELLDMLVVFVELVDGSPERVELIEADTLCVGRGLLEPLADALGLLEEVAVREEEGLDVTERVALLVRVADEDMLLVRDCVGERVVVIEDVEERVSWGVFVGEPDLRAEADGAALRVDVRVDVDVSVENAATPARFRCSTPYP
jgi:hypothetical protein